MLLFLPPTGVAARVADTVLRLMTYIVIIILDPDNLIINVMAILNFSAGIYRC